MIINLTNTHALSKIYDEFKSLNTDLYFQIIKSQFLKTQMLKFLIGSVVNIKATNLSTRKIE